MFHLLWAFKPSVNLSKIWCPTARTSYNKSSVCFTCHNHREPRDSMLNILAAGFVYLFGVLHHFQHCTGHITTGSSKGRGNQYKQFIRVLYCKLPANGKQLPAFPLEAVPRIKPRPQRWEARVLPLCHRGPY